MAAENHSWTINEVGNSEGPSSADRHKPDGQVDFAANFAVARQDLPTEGPANVFDINPAPGRVDVADPELAGCIPEPFAGDKGQPIDFNAVGPEEEMDRQLADESLDLDGRGAPGASSAGLPF